MEMCYDGALVMPSNYAVMSEDEMTYVDGGKSFYIKIKKGGLIINVLSAVGGSVTRTAMTAALNAIGVSIATSIELGTAGIGTLAAGAFILSWGAVASTIAGAAAAYGINKLGGKQFKVFSASFLKKDIIWKL